MPGKINLYGTISCLLMFAVIFALGCNRQSKNTIPGTGKKNDDSISIITDTAALKDPTPDINPIPDTLELKLFIIKENYQRINNIKSWKTVKKEVLEETSEGAEAIFYYSVKGLEKISTWHYGEMSRELKEYYLLNSKLSFLYCRLYNYNRPMYYDSSAIKDGTDTEAFDMSKSTIVETRNYFANDQLIHQIVSTPVNDSKEKVSLSSQTNLILTAFNELVKMSRR